MRFASPVPRVLAVAVLTLVLGFSPALAQKRKGEKTFSETTSVVVVEVPVTVTLDGAALTDLTAANFEILDGKKKRPILGFEVIDLTRVETLDPEEQPVPIAARRHFLMLFDMAFSRPEMIVRARQAARELVDSLHPTDLAGVATYTSARGANLILGFTSDRRQLELAIDTLGVPELVESNPDPLGIVFGRTREFGQGLADAAAPAGGGREEIADAANEQLLEAVGRISAMERSAQIDRVSAFTGNLEALARTMATIDGSKHLVYFSEGIPSDLLVGEAQTVEQQQARSTTDLWDLGGDETFGSTQAQNQLEGMIEQFRRAGCAIQAVDVGGVRARNQIGGRAAGEDSLVAMARDTGGEFFRNFNNLGVAMAKMLERTSVTYLLAFQPRDLEMDGAYHRLKVKLDGAPRGARLSHRAGYYAPKPYEEVGALQRRLETAEIILGDEEGGPIGLDVLAAAFPVPGQKAYVPVLLEIDGQSLLDGAGGDTLGLEIYAYATNADGGVHDYFVQSLGLDLTKAAAALRRSGVKYWGHFDLPPGRYTARVMVRDGRDGRYTLSRRPFTVPRAEGARGLLLPPMFPEPAQKWVLIREGEERRRDGVPYPFMEAGQPFIPAAKPVVPAKGSTPLYLRGLALAGDVELAGEVRSATGAPVEQAALRLVDSMFDGAILAITAALETRGLAPGEYTLVSEATDATGAPHSSSIRFVVQ